MDDFTYSYAANSNKVIAISDAVANAEFEVDYDSDPSTNQFAYDTNGNTIKDLNRGISSIEYNRLNLPVKITKTNGDIIEYNYNAAGQRLEKIINGELVGKYVRDASGTILYELDKDNKVKYSNLIAGSEILGQYTEESILVEEEPLELRRFTVRDSKTNQISIKDHLGNVRSNVKISQETYVREEFNSLVNWKNRFDNMNSAIVNTAVEFYAYPDPGGIPGENGEMPNIGNFPSLYQLYDYQGDPNSTMDLSISFKTDDVAVVKMYYINDQLTNFEDPFQQLTSNTSTALISNYEMPLKKNSATALENGWSRYSYPITIPSGTKYIIIELRSLRESDPIDLTDPNTVFGKRFSFDDIKVQRISEPERTAFNDYYPYGLISRSETSSESNPDMDKWKYQGKERDVETGYDYFEARFHDPAIARFMQVDLYAESFTFQNPFTSMDNNPINIVDPTGMYGERIEDLYNNDNDIDPSGMPENYSHDNSVIATTYKSPSGEVIHDDGEDNGVVIIVSHFHAKPNGETDWDAIYNDEKNEFIIEDPVKFNNWHEDISFSGTMSPFLLTAGGTSVADGPLPFGEIVGGVVIVGGLIYSTYEQLTYKRKSKRGKKQKKTKSGEQGGAEHTKNARPSTKNKHQKGKARKNKDKSGGEKGDKRRSY